MYGSKSHDDYTFHKIISRKAAPGVYHGQPIFFSSPTLLNSNKIYITVDGTFLAIRDKKTDTYLAIDAGVPRIDLKTLNGIKHYKLTEI